MNEEELYKIVFDSLEEINKILPNDEKIPNKVDVELIGINGALDSINFGTLIITIEDSFFKKYNVQIDLLEEAILLNDDLEDLQTPKKIVNLLENLI